MISKLVWILLLIPIATILVALSVANRTLVALTFDPFSDANPYLTVSAPLFAFLFLALIIGLIIGSFTTWVAQGKYRRLARSSRADTERLRSEMNKRDEQLRSAASLVSVG